MKKLAFIPIAFLLAFLFSTACSDYSYPSYKWNLSTIYNPLRTNLHPIYKVYHNNNKTSVLFLKIRTTELFFREGAIDNQKSCSFSIKYFLQEIGDEGNFIADSNTYVYEMRQKDVNKYYISQIPIKAQKGKSYRLKITLTDHYRNVYAIKYLEVEKRTSIGEQYFNVTTMNGTPLFKNVLINNGVFRINHESPPADSLYIAYYSNNFHTPQPLLASPSDNMRFRKHDSLFKVKYTPNMAFTLDYEGVYYVRFDTTSSHGISILKLNEDFPKTKEPEGLIPPLKYITSDAEFDALNLTTEPKKTADKFWVKTGGNIPKGRELIRLFYNRVYFSNYYFTNTSPGWMTDRGMIYVVYGPPHRIKKDAHSETWIYERKSDSDLIEFTFNYQPNQYALNNYILDRSNSHTWHWAEAVYAWTSGDIFLYD